MARREELIALYFKLGYAYTLIVCFLYFIHGISISLRQLKRVLARLNLRRRFPAPSVALCNRLVTLVKKELTGSGCLLGYRALWRRLKIQHSIPVTRDVVMKLLAALSPVDSQARRRNCLKRRTYSSKGPNWVWHCDGMDKLKPFGFAIHGCIDGYSRRIMWLKCATTNNNPRIVASFYLDCVRTVQGVPTLLRTDCGTENVNMAFIQPFLRRLHGDCFAGIESFRYGKSVSNQRIEAWWSALKRLCTHFWMELFKGLEVEGLYNNTNYVHVDCLRFCFMHIVQADLDRTVLEWNSHRIRPSNCSSPPGHPDQLYFMPELLGCQDYLCNLDRRDITVVQPYTEVPDPPVSLEFLQMVSDLMAQNNVEFPCTVKDAVELYS